MGKHVGQKIGISVLAFVFAFAIVFCGFHLIAWFVENVLSPGALDLLKNPEKLRELIPVIMAILAGVVVVLSIWKAWLEEKM